MAAPAAPGTSANSGEENKSFFEQFKQYILLPIDTALLDAAPEMGHLAPVILTFGTALLALVSLNLPMAVFSASTVEAQFLFNAAKGLSSYFVTPTLGISMKEETAEQKKSCHSYFKTLTPARFRFMMDQGLRTTFPNQALFFISFAASYCLQAMLFYSKELTELGPQFSNRPYLAMVGAGMFILLFAIYLLMFGCDSIFTIFFSILIGIVVGVLIGFQNNLFFGKESVNLLFIPTLADRKGMDYVCVSKTTQA